MNKREFLQKLENGLSGLPREDIEQRLSFYAEMIDDRIEDGFSEEEAVAGIGTPEEIAAQVIEETPHFSASSDWVRWLAFLASMSLVHFCSFMVFLAFYDKILASLASKTQRKYHFMKI